MVSIRKLFLEKIYAVPESQVKEIISAANHGRMGHPAVMIVDSDEELVNKVASLNGASIGRDLINRQGYLEVTFRPASGNQIDAATINGDELTLLDAAGHQISFTGSPVREGTSNTWRYTFATPLTAGAGEVLGGLAASKPRSCGFQSGWVVLIIAMASRLL